MTVKQKDPINPSYYTNGIPVNEFILSHEINFNMGNVIKYAVRFRYKNGIEDLKKIIRYVEMQIEHETKKETSWQD